MFRVINLPLDALTKKYQLNGYYCSWSYLLFSDTYLEMWNLKVTFKKWEESCLHFHWTWKYQKPQMRLIELLHLTLSWWWSRSYSNQSVVCCILLLRYLFNMESKCSPLQKACHIYEYGHTKIMSSLQEKHVLKLHWPLFM